MNLALTITGLALAWAAINGNFSPLNLLFGAAIGLLTSLLLRRWIAHPRVLRRLRRIVSLALLFFWELNVSAVRVAIIVLTPNIRGALRPGIVAFPLHVTTDREITLLANLITLTPGTLSVDVSEDRRVLYVHVLNLRDRDALIAEIANGFERKVQEVFE